MKHEKIHNLTVDQCLAGASAALANAKSLIDEAALLFSNGFFARAYALAHFSREEQGKASMLAASGMRLIGGMAVDWKKLDKRFRSHSKKIVNERLQLIATTPPKIAVKAGLVADEDAWMSLAMMGVKAAKYWEKRKNDSLYSDWDGSQFVEPSNAVTREQAERTLRLAQLSIDDTAMFVSGLAHWLNVDPEAARSHWSGVAESVKKIENECTEEEAIASMSELIKEVHVAIEQRPTVNQDVATPASVDTNT